MKKKFVISLDQGTSSSRAILFNRKAEIVDIVQKEFRQIYPKEAWVEHSPIDIWESQLYVLKQLIKKNKIDPREVDCIGITNQRETTIVWDKVTGKAVYNAIVWQDRRTSRFCNQLKEAGNEKMVTRKTGLKLDAYFSASKINWLLNNVKGIRAKLKKNELLFGTVDSWLIWNLTKGKSHLTDASNASRTMLFNIKSLKWDKQLLDLFGVPASMLPEVKNTSDDFGLVDSSILGVEVPITASVGDQQAALFGQMCTKKGMAKNTYGTGCFLVLNTGDQIAKSKNNLISTIGWQLNGKVSYALEGSVFMGGATIQWLRDGLEIIKSANESETMAQKVDDNGGVYFVPAMTGLGAPHWDQFARGAILGITRGTNKYHLIRAALEGICFQVKDVLFAMEKDHGVKLKELRVDGGAVENEFLLQLQADLARVKVVKPKVLETTALGAAYFAGLYTGFFESQKSLEQLWKKDAEYKAKISATKSKSLNDKWTQAVSKAKNWAS